MARRPPNGEGPSHFRTLRDIHRIPANFAELPEFQVSRQGTRAVPCPNRDIHMRRIRGNRCPNRNIHVGRIRGGILGKANPGHPSDAEFRGRTGTSIGRRISGGPMAADRRVDCGTLMIIEPAAGLDGCPGISAPVSASDGCPGIPSDGCPGIPPLMDVPEFPPEFPGIPRRGLMDVPGFTRIQRRINGGLSGCGGRRCSRGHRLRRRRGGCQRRRGTGF